MNIRKFTLVTSAVLMFFLLITGFVLLNQLNIRTATVINSGETSSTPFGGLLDDIIEVYKPFNILVLGGDKVNDNTDTIMLVNYDPSTTKANIVSIPRDTKVKIEGKIRKINFAYPHGGAKLSVETVSGLLGVNIKYYIYIDTSVFRRIIDNLGGIDNFYVPEDLNYDDAAQNLHINLKKGYQDLDGEKAEQFMRFRKYNSSKATARSENYDGSDIKRIQAQHNLLKELVRQKASLAYIHKFNDVVTEIFNSLETNMRLSEILSMAQNISKFKYDNINFYTLPGTAEYAYYMIDNQKTDEMMKKNFTGDDSFVDLGSVVGSYNEYRVQESDTKNDNESTTTKPKKSYTKNNPSNKETNVKKQEKPKP